MAVLHVPRVVFPEPGRTEIESIEVPDPAPDQIRVRVTKTLISAGSERNSFEMDSGGPRYPGYSAVGVLEAVGANVSGYREGDRVTTYSKHQGADLIAVGRDEPAQGMEQYAGRIPDGVTDAQATFIALSDVALHGVRRGAPYLGDPVAVFGQGVVGQLVAQFAQLAGAHPLIAVDLLDERLAKSRASGATHTVNAADEDAVERVLELTGGEGARVVFMVTRTPKILPDCMRAAEAGGSVTLVGSPPGTVEIRLQEELLRKELTVTGTYQTRLYPLEPYHKFHWTRPANRDYVFDLLARGKLAVDHLVSHTVPYTQTPDMYAMVSRGPQGWLGIVLDWESA